MQWFTSIGSYAVAYTCMCTRKKTTLVDGKINDKKYLNQVV